MKMKLELMQGHQKPKTQLLWVPLKSIKETYVMKRPVSPKKRAWIKKNIRSHGLKDALEVTPLKVRGEWGLKDGSLRKSILIEMFKAHESVIYRPTRQRVTEGKVPVIADITPLTPYEAWLDALRNNIDRRTVTMGQVGEFIDTLMTDEKLPWRSSDRGERILQFAADMDVTRQYIDMCVGLVRKSPPEARKDIAKGKYSHSQIKSLTLLHERPTEQRFLLSKMKDGKMRDENVARMAQIIDDLPHDLHPTNARMEEMAKEIAESPTGFGSVDIMDLPFIREAETVIPIVVAFKCSKGHTFTHIPCPECFEEAIKGKESCAQCPACNDQQQLSTLKPRIHLTMNLKELEKRLQLYMASKAEPKS